MKSRYLVLSCLCGLVSLVGCKLGQKEPVVFEAPPAALQLNHFSGSALSGPTTRPISLSGDALSVSIEMLALEQVPAGTGRPLAAEARWLLATRGEQPVLPSGKLSQSARLLAPTTSDLKAGRSASFGKAIGALPAGATVAVILDVPGSDPSAPRLELMVSRPLTAGALLQIAAPFETIINPRARLNQPMNPPPAPLPRPRRPPPRRLRTSSRPCRQQS